MELTIIEPHGWKKSVMPSKALIRIGADPANDISLTSAQISPVHLQIQYSPDSPSRCTVMNLGNAVEVLHLNDSNEFPAYAIFQVGNGDEIVLDSYRIQFSLPFVAQTVTDSQSIKAFVSFPDATLRPGAATIGTLTLQNDGLQSACQFEVALEGFPVDCMQIDPVPVLFPGAKEEIQIRLFHHKFYPIAGPQELILTISAPSSYPGEHVVIRQGLYVAPLLKHSMDIIDDLAIDIPSEKTEESPIIEPLKIPASGEVKRISSASGKSVQAPDETSGDIHEKPVNEVLSINPESGHQGSVLNAIQEIPEEPDPKTSSPSTVNLPEKKEETPGTRPEQGRPQPKVVKNLSDDFWDEETG